MRFFGLLAYALQAVSVAGAISTEKQMPDYLPSALDLLKRQMSLIPTSEGIFVFAEWFGSCIGAVIGMAIFGDYMRRSKNNREGALFVAIGAALCGVTIFWPLVIT